MRRGARAAATGRGLFRRGGLGTRSLARCSPAAAAAVAAACFCSVRASWAIGVGGAGRTGGRAGWLLPGLDGGSRPPPRLVSLECPGEEKEEEQEQRLPNGRDSGSMGAGSAAAAEW